MTPREQGASGGPGTPEPGRFARSAGIFAAGTLVSRLFGFLRDLVIARLFGAGAVTDAFFVAYRIPSLFRELLAEGSIAAAFVPVFTRYWNQRDRTEALRLAHAASSVLLVGGLVVVGLGILLAPWLVQVVAPGFGDDPVRYALTLDLTRWLFPYLIFVSLAALAMGMLQSVGVFAPTAFAPVMFSLSVIGCALILAPHMDPPIYALAVGVLLGGLGQWLVQVPSLYRQGISLGWRWEPGHPGVRQMLLLVGPVVLGLSVQHLGVLLNTILASFLPEGSVSYLYYAMRLVQFPQGVFGVALSSAILPTLSVLAARGEGEAFRQTLNLGLRLVFLITLPALAGLIVLREPLVQVLFQGQAFTPQDTREVARALVGYALGLWAFGGVRVLVQAFYAREDTKTPVRVALAAVGVGLLASVSLMGPLGHVGLALATSLGSMFQFGVLLVLLRRRMGPLGGGLLGRALIRYGVATLGMVLTVGSGVSWWSEPFPGGWAGALELLGWVSGGAGAYLIILWGLGCPEARFLLARWGRFRS